MRTTTLGSARARVGVLGLGCMGMTHAYDPQARATTATSVAVIRQALDLGMTLIDTADVYGPYTNEELVGRALAGGHRERAVLATKVGLVTDLPADRRRPRPELARHVAERPARARPAVDRREPAPAGHRPRGPLPAAPGGPGRSRWRRPGGRWPRSVAAGKARRIGLSEVAVEEIRRAQAVHPVASVQSELSLWTRDPLAEVLPYCEEQGIALPAVLAARPGLPRGPVLVVRASCPRATSGAGCRASSRTRCARTWPSSSGCARSPAGSGPPPRRWPWRGCSRQGRYVVPIPGTKTPRYLAENAGGRRRRARAGRAGRARRACRPPRARATDHPADGFTGFACESRPNACWTPRDGWHQSWQVVLQDRPAGSPPHDRPPRRRGSRWTCASCSSSTCSPGTGTSGVRPPRPGSRSRPQPADPQARARARCRAAAAHQPAGRGHRCRAARARAVAEVLARDRELRATATRISRVERREVALGYLGVAPAGARRRHPSPAGPRAGGGCASTGWGTTTSERAERGRVDVLAVRGPFSPPGVVTGRRWPRTACAAPARAARPRRARPASRWPTSPTSRSSCRPTRCPTPSVRALGGRPRHRAARPFRRAGRRPRRPRRGARRGRAGHARGAPGRRRRRPRGGGLGPVALHLCWRADVDSEVLGDGVRAARTAARAWPGRRSRAARAGAA